MFILLTLFIFEQSKNLLLIAINLTLTSVLLDPHYFFLLHHLHLCGMVFICLFLLPHLIVVGKIIFKLINIIIFIIDFSNAIMERVVPLLIKCLEHSETNLRKLEHLIKEPQKKKLMQNLRRFMMALFIVFRTV